MFLARHRAPGRCVFYSSFNAWYIARHTAGTWYWREETSELEQADEMAFVISSSEGLARMHP